MSRDLNFEATKSGRYYFLSYNSEDTKRVSDYSLKLIKSGIPLWYDKGLIYGDKWEETIGDKISKSLGIVFFFSLGMLEKDDSYAIKEFYIAKKLGKEIFIVLLDQPTKDLYKIYPKKSSFLIDVEQIHTPNNIDLLIDRLKNNKTNTDSNALKQEILLTDKLAKEGNVDAQYKLGLRFYYGDGLPQSYKNALYWLRKASKAGHVKATTLMGVCYGEGNGVDKSFDKALDYYKSAAKENEPNALYNLAIYNYLGLGCTKSSSKSKRYFKQAAKNGCSESKKIVNDKALSFAPNPNSKRNIPFYIISITSAVIGLLLLVLNLTITTDAATLGNLVWNSMCLLTFSVSALTYLAYGPYSNISMKIRILLLLLSFALVAGICGAYYAYLNAFADRFDADQSTILTAVLVCAATSIALGISFIIYKHRKISVKTYIFTYLIALPIALIATAVAVLMRMPFISVGIQLLLFVIMVFILNKCIHRLPKDRIAEESYVVSLDEESPYCVEPNRFVDIDGANWKPATDKK